MKKYVLPGDVVEVELPASEVCMYMRVSGQRRKIRVLERMAQILNDDGTSFSAPVTLGEAGLYLDKQRGQWYYYAPGPMVRVLFESLVEAMKEEGMLGCDHSVGICTCANKRLVLELDRAIGLDLCEMEVRCLDCEGLHVEDRDCPVRWAEESDHGR